MDRWELIVAVNKGPSMASKTEMALERWYCRTTGSRMVKEKVRGL